MPLCLPFKSFFRERTFTPAPGPAIDKPEDDKPETNETEAGSRLVWVKGYKATDANMQCNGFQYALGETFKYEGRVEMCVRGFHFCPELNQTFDYYAFNFLNRYFEVEALIDPEEQYGWMHPYSDKRVAHEIRFLREIPVSEVYALVEDQFPFIETDDDLSAVIGAVPTRTYEDFAFEKFKANLRDKYSATFIQVLWDRYIGNDNILFTLMKRAVALYAEGVSPDMRAYLLLK